MRFRNLLLIIIVGLSSAKLYANEAFGKPGIALSWSSAKKTQVGTTFNWDEKKPRSLVWFTNAKGILTETYYPTIDQAQIKDAQLLVTDHKTFLTEEKTGTTHKVIVKNTSLTTLNNTDKKKHFNIKHTFYTLSDKSVLVDEVKVTSKRDGLYYYLLVNSSINNTGANDTALVTKNQQLLFTEGENSLRVSTDVGLEKLNVGFVGYSDIYQDLHKDYSQDYFFTKATKGNVAGSGQIKIPATKGTYTFYIIYQFKSEKPFARSFEARDWASEKKLYQNRWQQYLDKLITPSMPNKYKKLYHRSLYTLKVHEDKINKGAFIASLSKPWGESTVESPGVFTGGYHLVWPRDLYHVSLALIEAGDYESAVRALSYLKKIQYQSGTWTYGKRVIPRKGAFPQNTWTNGKEYWGGFQLDQVGYPVHLFYQLYRKLDDHQKKLFYKKYKTMVLAALNFIQKYGPWSAQERWEENYGISPSSFAVAASALFLGSRITGNNSYKKTAETWLYKPGDNINTWAFTTNGVYGDGEYYLRVSGCGGYTANWNPNQKQRCTIANSHRKVIDAKILDQGFLKLSLLGILPASDWRIKKSLEKVNNNLRVKTPNGFGWYRYTFDAYGENKKGRLWPLLSGEHARYAIERYRTDNVSWEKTYSKVKSTLDSYLGFANDGLMIPEQVFERSGEGTGAATPLAWSHAEYIKLIWSSVLKENVENVINR